jgi:hypothetical protein
MEKPRLNWDEDYLNVVTSYSLGREFCVTINPSDEIRFDDLKSLTTDQQHQWMNALAKEKVFLERLQNEEESMDRFQYDRGYPLYLSIGNPAAARKKLISPCDLYSKEEWDAMDEDGKRKWLEEEIEIFKSDCIKVYWE